ncbi:Coatomer Subunit Delta [Manis pentadactyla]|nr:Coatomer Subunit Delta [Manis pentadactyla]
MTEQRSGGGARSIRQHGDRPSENGLASPAGEGRLAGAAAARHSDSAAAASGSLQPGPGATTGSRCSAVCVRTDTPRVDRTEAVPSPPFPGGFHHVAEPGYRTGGRVTLSPALPSAHPAVRVAPLGSGPQLCRLAEPPWALHLPVEILRILQNPSNDSLLCCLIP